MNVVFIGYRATGKTSVGRQVALRLGFSFHDTDEEVTLSTGKTIRELVDEGGWALFREAERCVIARLSEKHEVVLSLGGGAVMDEENVRLFSRGELFVWLRADAKTIVERMSKDEKDLDQRPSLSGNSPWDEVSTVLQAREEAYRRIANHTVDTVGRSIEEVTEEVLKIVMNDE